MYLPPFFVDLILIHHMFNIWEKKRARVFFSYSYEITRNRNDTTLPQQETMEKIVWKYSVWKQLRRCQKSMAVALKRWVRTVQRTNLHGCHFTLCFLFGWKTIQLYWDYSRSTLRLPVFQPKNFIMELAFFVIFWLPGSCAPTCSWFNGWGCMAVALAELSIASELLQQVRWKFEKPAVYNLLTKGLGHGFLWEHVICKNLWLNTSTDPHKLLWQIILIPIKDCSRWWFQRCFYMFIPGEMIHFDEHIFQLGGSTT